MLYQLYDMQHAMLTPMRIMAEATRSALHNPLVPASYTEMGRAVAAGAELFERTTRRFGKPAFGLTHTTVEGRVIPVHEEIAVVKPFCNLLRFRRDTGKPSPQMLLVAPVSGHHATLLRGTVEAMLPHYDVYVTDWIDARLVPLTAGDFGLQDYISYVMEFLTHLGPETHVMAVCQPAVPVLAAVALMAAADDPNQPRSMTLMGGPIDTSAAPTVVTKLAEGRPLSWFERTVVTAVPFYYPGAMRRVYPGFLQLTGFMTMNLERHIGAHLRLFEHLVRGDNDSADAHRHFYDEYLSVMDMTADFYLETVSEVFQKRSLPKGEMMWHGERVDCGAIRHTALMTVEGELDDISAPGQTRAAHGLCSALAAEKKTEYLQKGVGHYGIFNGRRWREEVLPQVRAFVERNNG